MGRLCVHELVRALDGSEAGRRVKVPIDLVIRDSTAGLR
jgi:DNA-binding LacI/PurR family transcriptional regulator